MRGNVNAAIVKAAVRPLWTLFIIIHGVGALYAGNGLSGTMKTRPSPINGCRTAAARPGRAVYRCYQFALSKTCPAPISGGRTAAGRAGRAVYRCYQFALSETCPAPISGGRTAAGRAGSCCISMLPTRSIGDLTGSDLWPGKSCGIARQQVEPAQPARQQVKAGSAC